MMNYTLLGSKRLLRAPALDQGWCSQDVPSFFNIDCTQAVEFFCSDYVQSKRHGVGAETLAEVLPSLVSHVDGDIARLPCRVARKPDTLHLQKKFPKLPRHGSIAFCQSGDDRIPHA